MLHTLCCPFGIIYTSLHNDMINTKISAKAFFSYESKNRFSFLALAICMPIILLAKNIDISSLPISNYADTEVATNVVLNKHRNDVKELEFKFKLDCSSSNCIQVAFGEDANKDGVLSFQETGVLYGWRNGRYFIEDVREGERYEYSIESEDRTGMKNFVLNLRTKRNYLPNEFFAKVDGMLIFTNLSVSVPSWLYQPKWNLMRITRRGVSAPAEWFDCKVTYCAFYITVR